MSEIDVQNAKSIRDPMDVVVSLASNDSNDMTISLSGSYTPYYYNLSTASEPWEMRVLADLQYEGFPLDGSRVLYDSTVADSEEDGKIGIRGHAVDATRNYGRFMLVVSSPETIANLTINVTGCKSILSYISGTSVTYSVTSDVIVLPINAKSVSLTFYQEESYKRIEISRIVAGVQLTFTNDNLISVNLNLRSDLKPIDPTLPESEIEVKAYIEQDLSEVMSNVMENQPITYSAGYAGDMSEERNFYLSEQATWDKGILTMKGIDAVHLLDAENYPFVLGNPDPITAKEDYFYTNQALWRLYKVVSYLLEQSGISFDQENANTLIDADAAAPWSNQMSIIKRSSQRDIIANLMNLCHFSFQSAYFEDVPALWITYRDAGIPKLTWTKPTSAWDIYEADCGDVQRRIDRKTASFKCPAATVRRILIQSHHYIDTGGELFKNSGLAPAYIDYEYFKDIGFPTGQGWGPIFYVASTESPGHRYMGPAPNYIALALYDSEVDKNKDLNADLQWTTWIDWNDQMQRAWDSQVNNDKLPESAESAQMGALSGRFTVSDYTLTVDNDIAGANEEASKTSWYGVHKAKTQTGKTLTLLPTLGIKQLLARSKETGSFTWKGDPRMQPRDVFTFHRLDGTTEDCTVESISLKHEKGGTIATITYRKGIV